MSAEATNPANPGPITPGAHRRRARPRIDLRRLGRAALLGPAARGRLPDAIGHVAEAHRAHYPDAVLEPLHRAYVLAESSHRGQMRKSGEPYITHPLAVTLILAELGAETTTLTASSSTTPSRTPRSRSTRYARSSARRSPISSTA